MPYYRPTKTIASVSGLPGWSTNQTGGLVISSDTAPTTREDGAPLVDGDYWFNTKDEETYLYITDDWQLIKVTIDFDQDYVFDGGNALGAGSISIIDPPVTPPTPDPITGPADAVTLVGDVSVFFNGSSGTQQTMGVLRSGSNLTVEYTVTDNVASNIKIIDPGDGYQDGDEFVIINDPGVTGTITVNDPNPEPEPEPEPEPDPDPDVDGGETETETDYND